MTRSTARFINDHAPSPSMYTQAGARFRVLCSDGRVRIATVTAEDADSMYTIPARVSVNGRTVTGSVSHRGNLDYSRPGWPSYDDGRTVGSRTPEYRFTANLYRRNGHALPEWAPSAPYTASV